MVRAPAALGPYLDRLTATYGAGHLDTDPVGEVRRFTDPDDLEVAGFLAAGLAFGRVATIRERVRDLWARLDHAPAAVVDGWRAADARRLHGFRHRWIGAEDLAMLLAGLGRARRRHGSLHRLFLAGYEPRDPDLAPSLSRFVAGIRAEVRVRGVPSPPPAARLPRGVRAFLADPAGGAACKRLNLYLRWMVREDDGVDLGLFRPVRPAQLVIPVDTHVARIGRNLGLTARRTVGWRMAAEITENLRRWDGEDPVRYDFALSRLGILDACPTRLDPGKCRACDLVTVCRRGPG